MCESCGSLMLMGWVACPYCGWQNDMLMNSHRSLVELVQMNSDRELVGGCSGSCSGKKKKKMTPNPHYINMIINFSILGTLIYVAIQVS